MWRVFAAIITLALLGGCRTAPRAACNPDPAPGAVGSICGFANPEDIEVVPAAGVLLVSQMRRGATGGSLAAISLAALALPGLPANHGASCGKS